RNVKPSGRTASAATSRCGRKLSRRSATQASERNTAVALATAKPSAASSTQTVQTLRQAFMLPIMAAPVVGPMADSSGIRGVSFCPPSREKEEASIRAQDLARRVAIVGDLGLQGFQPGEFHLRADEVDQGDAHRAAVEVAVEAQNVDLEILLQL